MWLQLQVVWELETQHVVFIRLLTELNPVTRTVDTQLVLESIFSLFLSICVDFLSSSVPL